MAATASGSFGSVQLPDWNFLLDTADGKTTADVARTQIKNQGDQLTNQGAQQDLTDRDTLRGLAPGLATRDPNAVAGAAVLRGGAGAVNSLSGMDAAQAQIQAERAKLMMLQPDTSGPPVGGSVAPGPQSSVGTDIAPSLASRESGNDPSAVNAGGYSGMFQQGAARLSDPGIGVYTPAKGEDVNANTWNGTFSIPGFPEVKTHADFLKSPGAQRVALAAEVANTNQAIASTPGADKFSQSGLQAVAHLGGVAGMQKFVATGGAYNPGDNPRAPGGGTHLSDYYNHFAQGGPAALQATFGHPDGPPQSAAAPGVTVAPAPVAAAPALAPVQVATRGPIAGDTASDAVPSGAAQPPAPGFDAAGNPLPAGSWNASPVSPPAAPTGQGVDGVMTRLRAGQPQIPNPNALLGVASPGGSIAQPAPNALAGSAPASSPQPAPAQPPTPTPTPAAPAVPVQPQAAPAGGIGEAPAGAVMLRQPITHLPWPGAAPGNAYFKLPDGSVQQFNDPSQPQPLTHSDSGTVRTFFDKSGRPVSTQAIPGTGRETLVDLGDGRHQMEKDGKLIGPIFPASTREFTIKMAGKDQDLMPGLSQQALEQEQTLQKTIEARNTAAGLPTGSNFESRQATSNWVKTYFPKVADLMGVGADGNLFPDPAKGAEAAKLLTGAAQQNEKAMGGSGGLGITQMFVANNPNLGMQPAAIRDMSNLNAVTAMATKDYLQGKMNHIDANTQNLQQPNGTYKPSSAFDKSWFSNNNTLTYYAAIQAMNGKPWDTWSKGLNDDDKARALGVIARIDPTATVTGRNGHPLAVSGFKPADPANPSGVVAQ